jgi:ADP-ribose pyrophosphatase
MEETKFKASSLCPLISYSMAPGYSTELLHLYMAQGLTPAYAEGDWDEDISLVEMTIEEAVAAVLTGRIMDSKSISAILLAERIVRGGLSVPK